MQACAEELTPKPDGAFFDLWVARCDKGVATMIETSEANSSEVLGANRNMSLVLLPAAAAEVGLVDERVCFVNWLSPRQTSARHVGSEFFKVLGSKAVLVLSRKS